MDFCFLDENGDMQIDIVEALKMFEKAATELLEHNVGSEELPFFLFLCGAEAMLRTSEEEVLLH